MNFSTPLSEIPRIGPVFQKRLKTLGILSVRDLLFYFPREYEDFSKIRPVAEAKANETFCAQGKILEIQERRTYQKRFSITEAIAQDQSGAVKLLWFNQPFISGNLKKDEEIVFAGKVIHGKEGIYVSNPAFEKILNPKSEIRNKSQIQNPKFQTYSLTHVGRIIPVYAETKGVSSRWIRSIIKNVLVSITEFSDILPSHIVKEEKLLPFKRALWQIHFPDSLELAKTARERFAFEELFFILLFILSERQKIAEIKAPSIPFDASLMKRFTQKLPFVLTDSQKQAAWHILKDMENPRPMNRLLQGDVGSGKTVVASMAALSAIRAGCQAVFMAPTEILAQQHFKSVAALLTPFKITIGLLTGSADRFISPKLPNDYIEISREKLIQKSKENKINLLIGTHALIQDKVKFSNLALVIVDEQHRFGVKQRAKLLHRSSLIPHLLSLTATPIPRTLAMTIYGDLDISTIAELPKGRKIIETTVVPPEKRNEAYAFIEDQIKLGRQAFVICPRIEQATDDKRQIAEIKTVKEEYEKLSKTIFPNFRLAMLHGKMPSKEKERTMQQMKRGKIDILVSTTVLEVGVDIPNASVMLIEGADRFGLAQLHQLRGRVGRSEHQSYCFLFTEGTVGQRLKALTKFQTGFELAEMDLKIRGPGDFSGTKQWGIPDFAMHHLADLALVTKARESAKKLLEEDVSLRKYPLIRVRIQELKEKLHLE